MASELEAVLSAMAKADQKRMGESHLEKVTLMEGVTSLTPAFSFESRPKGARVRYTPPMTGLATE